MHKLLLLTTLAAGIAALAGGACAADAATTTEQSLLGKDPGTAEAYACYARHYDAPHLASHPNQNVTGMSLFVDNSYDADTGRLYNLQLGIGFRRLKRQFQVSGNCSTTVDGKSVLTCGVDCDGGSFNISTGAASSVLVAIPDGVAIWDPNAPDDQPNALPKGAAFGKDDKLFKLDRADLKQCESLMTEDVKAAVFKK